MIKKNMIKINMERHKMVIDDDNYIDYSRSYDDSEMLGLVKGE